MPSRLAIRIRRLCGGLPLAIRVAAARLKHRPMWRVADLVGRLSEDRWLADISGDGLSPTSSLAMSYHYLDPDQQSMLRLLGAFPGPDVDQYVGAALADLPVGNADQVLENLLDGHLVEQPTAYRYRMHDLVKQYIRTLTDETSAPREGEANRRMLDYFVHTAKRAALLIGTTDIAHVEIDVGRPRAAPALAGYAEALAWLDGERQNLMSAGGTR